EAHEVVVEQGGVAQHACRAPAQRCRGEPGQATQDDPGEEAATDVAEAGGVDKGDGDGVAGRVQFTLQGYPAAVGAADEMGALDIRRGEDLVEPVGPVPAAVERLSLHGSTGFADRIDGD